MRTKQNVHISTLTTMRLGGPAHYLLEIESAECVHDAYRFANEQGLSTYVIGGGSNIIGQDDGFDGVILLNKIAGLDVLTQTSDELLLCVGSGEELDAVVNYAVDRSWCGIEALAAIPGTVGGAVMQNAGAYGQEISDVLVSVEVYDIARETCITIEVEHLDLSYRRSIFNTSARGRYFIVSATLRLHKREIEGELYWSLQAYLNEHGITDRHPTTVRDAVAAIRAVKLPDPAVQASSGSFFKKITVREEDIESLCEQFPGIPIYLIGGCWEIASGWLIEQCGLKGKLLHGMRVSDKAALILINESAHSYKDLAAARAEIVSAVQERFGFILQQEPEEI